LNEAELLGHVERANDALRGGDLVLATREVDAALAIAPRDVRARMALGLLFFKQDRYGEAGEVWTAVLVSDPGSAPARLTLGLAQLERGERPAAALELERALVLDPRNQRARGYLGLAYARLGDKLRAREAFLSAGREDLARALAEQSRAGDGAEDGAALVEVAAERAIPKLGGALRVGAADGPPGLLVASAAEGVYLRRQRWIGMTGDVALAPELPRSALSGRGAAGVGEPAFVGAWGGGEILISGGPYAVIPLRSEVVYVVAEALCAWTAGLRAESGCVPADRAAGAAPMSAVRLAGRGAAAVRTAGPIVTAPVAEGRTARVARGALVGWTGGVRVRVVAASAASVAGGADGLAVRVGGEGAMLLDAAT
jgi:uncharacterized protein (AIM24 family)